jgi:Rod binding domain-containing protein
MAQIDTSVAMYSAQKMPEIRLDESDKALREQTDAFEAVFLKQMLDITMKSNDSMFPKGPGSDIYKSMYTQTLSDNLAGTFGFSDMLFNYLKNK